MQGEEITALQKLANVPLNDELVRKAAKKELKGEQKKKRAIVEYSRSTDSGNENEKPQRKNRKKRQRNR